MSLLDELHQRVNRLTERQQHGLKLWLDYIEKRQASDEETQSLGEAGVRLASEVLPKEDWTSVRAKWAASQDTRRDNAAG